VILDKQDGKNNAGCTQIKENKVAITDLQQKSNEISRNEGCYKWWCCSIWITCEQDVSNDWAQEEEKKEVEEEAKQGR